MIYSSVSFIFFAVLVVIIHIFLPVKIRSWWLLLSSLVWLFSWEWSWGIIFIAISAINLLSLKKLNRAEEGSGSRISRDQLFATLVTFNLFVFIFLKSASLIHPDFKTPYGISFFMFMHLGFIIDVWRSAGQFAMEKNHHYFLFPSFFPELVGGPIMRGKDFFSQIRGGVKFNLDDLMDGLLIFTVGFCKFYFLSKSLAAINSAFLTGATRMSILYLFFFGLSGTVQAYVDFSSYCDMGRGLARGLGLALPVNFTPFYYARNPNDFWQRWNITLGTWIRDYISFPLMLRFGRKISPNVIMLFSFLLVGLWHGLTLNWIFFGLFNGFIIIFYNYLNKKKRVPALGPIAAFCIFIGNGVFQRTNSAKILGHIFSTPGLYYFPNSWPLRWGREIDGLFTVALLLLIAYDYFMEKKGADWPALLARKTKLILVLMILISFFAALHFNLFMEEITLPPAYFRI